MNRENFDDLDIQKHSSSYGPLSGGNTEQNRSERDFSTEADRQQVDTEGPHTQTEFWPNREGFHTETDSAIHWQHSTRDIYYNESEHLPQLTNYSISSSGHTATNEPRVYHDFRYEDLLEIIESEPSAEKRAAAVRTLGLFDKHDSRRVLLAALRDKNKMVRAAALEAATNLAHRLPVALVEVGMTDSSWFVRATAMWAFSYFGDKAPLKRIAALADDEEESVQVRYWALYTLGELHDSTSAYRFLQLLNNKNTDEQLREIAAVALGRVGPLEDKPADLALTILRDRLRSRKEVTAVRVASAHALAQRSHPPDDETFAILRIALTDEDKQVRQAVQQALDTIIERLVAALYKPIKAGQTYAEFMSALCKLHDRVSELVFEQLLSHADVAVRQAALQILNAPDKDLLSPHHPFGYVQEKHTRSHLKPRGIKIKQVGDISFYPLTPTDLKETLLAQALDGHWIPRSLLHLIMSKGADKKFSYTDISPYMNKLIRTEYIRSLLHSRSVVIPLPLLYSSSALFNDFLPQRANREAFKWLLTAGAILPLLSEEHSPNQQSAFTPSTNGFAAWQRICQEVRLLCVRFSWNEHTYREIENTCLEELQTTIIEDVHAITVTSQGEQGSKKISNEPASRLQEITTVVRKALTPLQIVEDLYERFLLVDGSRSREHFYDNTKPYASETKQVIDLAYNKSLSNTLKSRLLTPGDTPSLTILPTRANKQPLYTQIALTSLHIMQLIRHDLFPDMQAKRYLKSLRLLSLQDIVELRSTHSWNEYMDAVQSLYTSTPENIAQRITTVYQKYTDLAAYITGMLDGREPDPQRIEIYANWIPTPTLQFNIAGALLFITWSADDVFYHFNDREPVVDATGKAGFTTHFSIGEWQDERATNDLAISFNFMNGMLEDAKHTLHRLKEQLPKHLHAIQLKQVHPIKAGPELSY